MRNLFGYLIHLINVNHPLLSCLNIKLSNLHAKFESRFIWVHWIMKSLASGKTEKFTLSCKQISVKIKDKLKISFEGTIYVGKPEIKRPWLKLVEGNKIKTIIKNKILLSLLIIQNNTHWWNPHRWNNTHFQESGQIASLYMHVQSDHKWSQSF